jgi:hypothetical protein
MRLFVHTGPILTLVLSRVAPLHAQDREGLMGDLIKDVTEVESKIVGLAKAMPWSK